MAASNNSTQSRKNTTTTPKSNPCDNPYYQLLADAFRFLDHLDEILDGCNYKPEDRDGDVINQMWDVVCVLQDLSCHYLHKQVQESAQ